MKGRLMLGAAIFRKRMSIKPLRALVPLLALAAAACDGVSGPSGVEGSYTVRSVNGHAPPFGVSSTPEGSTMEVVDASLDLDAGNATIEVKTRTVGADGSTSPSVVTTFTGTYQVNQDIITFAGLQSTPAGVGVGAEGFVFSRREVLLDLYMSFASSAGLVTYPLSLVFRR
jgi:hypothetical protein